MVDPKSVFPKPAPHEQKTIYKEVSTDLCPIIGVATMVEPPKIARPDAMPEIKHILQACIKERCALWSVERGGCSVKIGMDSLPALLEQLAPLARTFGGR